MFWSCTMSMKIRNICEYTPLLFIHAPCNARNECVWVAGKLCICTEEQTRWYCWICARAPVAGFNVVFNNWWRSHHGCSWGICFLNIQMTQMYGPHAHKVFACEHLYTHKSSMNPSLIWISLTGNRMRKSFNRLINQTSGVSVSIWVCVQMCLRVNGSLHVSHEYMNVWVWHKCVCPSDRPFAGRYFAHIYTFTQMQWSQTFWDFIENVGNTYIFFSFMPCGEPKDLGILNIMMFNRLFK